MADYLDFLASKRVIAPTVGMEVSEDAVHPSLFPFQRRLVTWACKKGRAAIWADTGLGKTRMQLEWARLMGEKSLIVAPLLVVQQTITEAGKLGIDVTYSGDGVCMGQFTITNYERVERFNPDDFGAVVLDESSILKNLSGATRKLITEMFSRVPYRLCCTATPAPNDTIELAGHAAFLGVMSRADMLATFFMHSKDPGRDGASSTDGYTLKAHARQPFYRWLASWGIHVRKPSDLGFDDTGYELPPLSIIPLWVDFEYVPEGQLFNTGLKGVSDRSKVRRGTLEARAELTAELVNASTDPFIVWVGLNDEEKAIARMIPDSVVITGSMQPEQKAALLTDFQNGEYRVLITKTSIAGFGVNLQMCAQQIFMGMNDSYEEYYQAIRRSYRFGQTKPVNIYTVLSHVESPVYENVMRKEKTAKAMGEELIKQVQSVQLAELALADDPGFVYRESELKTERYHIMQGDSCQRLKELPDNSMDFSLYSLPFSSMYAYTPDSRDLGNSRGMEEFFVHMRYITDEVYRLVKPGRNVAIHCMQLPATINYHGFMGLIDFRGAIIQHMTNAGFHYYGEAVINKNPQVQAQRSKKRNLLFVTLRKDSAVLAPGIPDYVLIFKKPGVNQVPVTPIENGEMTEETWISWASPVWTTDTGDGIRETDVLNRTLAKEDKDEKHIAPLQLEVIRRFVTMYTNPGETVLDPFGGIGSTGVVAMELGRKTVMCELKPSYYKLMAKNMANAVVHKPSLFDLLAEYNAANGNGYEPETEDSDGN